MDITIVILFFTATALIQVTIIPTQTLFSHCSPFPSYTTGFLMGTVLTTVPITYCLSHLIYLTIILICLICWRTMAASFTVSPARTGSGMKWHSVLV